MVEWNIRPRGRSCAFCQRAFVGKDPCVSILKDASEGSGFERLDVCPACWKSTPRDWEPFSVWEGVFEEPVQEKKPEPLKKDTAEELLRRLVTLDDPEERSVVYLLAVMLERSRILIERGIKTQEDGTTLRIYEHRKSGDTFLILDPHLRLDDLSAVQHQVIDLLSGTTALDEAAAASPEGETSAAQPSENAPVQEVGDGQ